MSTALIDYLVQLGRVVRLRHSLGKVFWVQGIARRGLPVIVFGDVSIRHVEVGRTHQVGQIKGAKVQVLVSVRQSIIVIV